MNRSKVEIINDNKEEIAKFHKQGWGESDYYITKEQLQELMDGKLIAIFDGEYTKTIKLKNN